MKIGRYLLILIIGGIIGGLFGGIIGSSTFKRIITSLQFTNHTTVIVLTIIAVLINAALLVVLYRTQRKSLNFKNKLVEDIDDDKADYYEKKANTYYLKVSAIFYALISVSLIHIFVIVLGYRSDYGSEYDALLAMVPFLGVMIAGTIIGFYYRKFEPRLPKQGEKNYTDKVFNIMDEGERYITLVSMFKVYHWNLIMLMVGTLFLGIYSMATDMNQGMSILILIIIFMYNSFGYLTKVRKFYKN